MLRLAIFIGIYSYLIFALGLFRLFYPLPITLVSILVWGSFCFSERHDIANLKKIKPKFTKSEKIYILLIAILLLVNFLGTLGPELAFDALWYHLTIPKIFIEHHSIFYIKNQLFYYSLMPKLAEMLYIPLLMAGGELFTKILQFFFGILTAVNVFKIIRLYVKRAWSLLGVVIFLTNLVVSWMMITSYIDLTRAFYESLALFYFLLFVRNRKTSNLIFSSILLGLAITAKIVSISSLCVYLPLVVFISTGSVFSKIKKGILYLLVSLLIPFPYFLYSYLKTGSFLFPVFSSYAPNSLNFTNLLPINLLKNTITVFLFSPDPINPLYVIAFPIIILGYKTKNIKFPLSVAILSLIFWYMTSFLGIWHATDSSGSARFLISYFPIFTLLIILSINSLKDNFLKKAFIFIIIFGLLTTIFYRLAANSKYLPLILGFQSKQDFLMKNLNFEFGDFYDENSDIKNIVSNNLVLTEGIHNLYYADFRFTLDRWDDVKEAKFKLVGGDTSINTGELVYKNSKTHVKLYKL